MRKAPSLSSGCQKTFFFHHTIEESLFSGSCHDIFNDGLFPLLKVGKVYRLEITLGHGDRGRRKREGEEKRGKKKNDLTFSFKRYLYAHQGSGNTKRGIFTM